MAAVLYHQKIYFLKEVLVEKILVNERQEVEGILTETGTNIRPLVLSCVLVPIYVLKYFWAK